jgi:hypothetical protein
MISICEANSTHPILYTYKQACLVGGHLMTFRGRSRQRQLKVNFWGLDSNTFNYLLFQKEALIA